MVEIKIYIDDREPDKLCKKAEKIIPGIEKKRLKVGDIVCNERSIVIERKEVRDFAQSLQDRRIYRQVNNMKENYENCYVIIIGDFLSVLKNKYIHFNTKQLIGGMASIAVRYNIPVIRVDNNSQFLQLSKAIIEKSDGKKVDEEKIVLQTHRTKDVNLNILTCIPGIGPGHAKRILENYDSVGEICNTSVEDLMKIKGVGKQKAENIKKWLV